MKLIQRGNKQLRIADDQIEQYREIGYIEVDEITGKPLSVPAETNDVEAENERLRIENEELRAQLAAAGVSAEPAQTPAVWTCPYCGKTYKTEKGLTDHIAKEHPEEIEG